MCYYHISVQVIGDYARGISYIAMEMVEERGRREGYEGIGGYER